MKRLFWLLVISNLWFSCKELEDPISTTTEPVFYIKGLLNTDSLKVIAGAESYYHFTTHQLDPLNIYEFSSELKRNDCQNCDDKIKITIRAHQKSNNNSINIFDALTSKNYSYIENIAQPKHRLIKFEIDTTFNPIGSSALIHWDFGDGNISLERSPLHYYNTDGRYTVKLDYQINTCIGSVIKELAIQQDTLSSLCKVDFKYLLGNPAEVIFFGVDSTVPSSFLWDFGDGNFSVEMSPIHVYTQLKSYNVKLIVNRIGIGCVSTITKVVDLLQPSCPVTFTYNPTEPTISDSLNYSKVLVEYTSSTGNYFRSDLTDQSLSNFNISDVEPYENNELNDKTVKFKVNFSCDLQNQSGQQLKLKSVKGIIGVSYP